MASVQPLLKKPHLDPSTLTNYRAISKLPFASKILEKLVCKQLLELVEENHIFDKYQSGFRQKHSTETALLRVTNDILMQSDCGDIAILVLLDLSAAFDTVDHAILIDRLEKWVGITGIALNWFSSYLSNRRRRLRRLQRMTTSDRCLILQRHTEVQCQLQLAKTSHW